jgi:hypothetical protein
MAKMRMELGDKKSLKISNLISPNEVNSYYLKNINEKTVCEVDLKKKFGQLIYLEHLLKVEPIVFKL